MENTTTTKITVKSSIPDMAIYVASLSDYNAGRLVGKWIDIEFLTDESEISDEIQEFLESLGEDENGQEREEWAIHDYNGLPASEFGEYPDLCDIAAYVEACDQHDQDTVNAFLSIFNLSELSELEDKFCGKHSSFQDYVEESFRDCNEIPESLDRFIDWESMARDWQYSGEYSVAETSDGDYIFRNY